ncbi:Hydrolase [Rhodovulum sp. P5]|uniref:HAD-IA family hydrolase n=1 Tax=Rhodovulum sp. P5 TaxID=1564506 RepID=UPI0009C26C3D|nr:HAD-IA family hydrolase [Rhodovulum sp. P5]ARE40298.1 Hydrolase [Rhodovulum sp. P5]
MPIDAVVFDIGRVMIEWDPDRFYDRTIGPARRERLFAEVDLRGMNLSVDAGADFEQAVEGLAAQHPDWANEIRLWRSHWIEMASPAIPHSTHLLKALKAKGVPVFALSNMGGEPWQIACAAYPDFALFDRTYISGQLRQMKPGPDIYRTVEEDSSIAPERLLFTDDTAANIDAAAARGWQTHLFDGPEGWATRLVAAGLLTAKEATPDA